MSTFAYVAFGQFCLRFTLVRIDDTEAIAHAARLDAERAVLLEQLRASELDLAGVRELRAEAVDDEHDPEGSTLSSDWSRIVGLGSATRERLAATDRAIARLADGSYGNCLRCGRPIGEGRLEARPAAELCIECARLVA